MSAPIVDKFVIKRHSRRPYFNYTAQDPLGNVIDLSGALSATFLMYAENSYEKVNALGVIETPLEEGKLRYEWQAGDLDTEGEFVAEFNIDYGGGEVLTIPCNGYILIRVYSDLDDS